MVAQGSRSERFGSRRPRLELASAILLACATVATAWAAYQARQWTGEPLGLVLFLGTVIWVATFPVHLTT
jgi:hypothetical protein